MAGLFCQLDPSAWSMFPSNSFRTTKVGMGQIWIAARFAGYICGYCSTVAASIQPPDVAVGFVGF